MATTCTECGRQHAKDGKPTCTGHVTYDRQSYVKGQDRKKLPKPRPCMRWPTGGQTKCHMHGAASPQAKRGAAKRLTVQAIAADAQALLASEGIDGVDDPIAEIGRLAVEALALKRAAGSRANALDDIVNSDSRGIVQLQPQVEMYERALDRSMKFLEIVTRHTSRQDVDDTKAMLRQLGQALGL